MAAHTVSGMVPEHIFKMAEESATYGGTTLSAIMTTALALYLELPPAAQRTARYVLASGTEEARTVLSEGCGRAIARAGNTALSSYLIARGKELGLNDPDVSDDALAQEAVRMVAESRRRRGLADDGVPQSMSIG